MLMRLTKGTKKALSLALSTALVLTGANVGTLKADAADKDGVELTLKGETLNKKEATVKADGKVEVTTTFADAATAGALAGANFGETTTTVENVTEDFDLKIVSVKVGDKDVLSKKAVYGEYADSNTHLYVVLCPVYGRQAVYLCHGTAQHHQESVYVPHRVCGVDPVSAHYDSNHQPHGTDPNRRGCKGCPEVHKKAGCCPGHPVCGGLWLRIWLPEPLLQHHQPHYQVPGG